MRRNKIPQTFSLSFDQIDRLDRLAERRRTTRSALAQEAIELILERYETAKAGSGTRRKGSSGVAALGRK